ncbi:MAG: divalent metal cation transporter [Bacteroidota bacterium]|nr:divalent metal cation transporter [Bacteroidota bacterium]
MKNFFNILGPGILFASTAIGVSHLVQSTRAGAGFGFALVVFVLMANIFKYPFFEFGSRYANVTGESLIHGYRRQGIIFLIIYLLITLCSMFIVIAAVSLVCSGLMIELFDIQFNIRQVTLLLFVCCVIILISGRYNFLENFVKLIAVVLLISTFLAFIFAIFNGPVQKLDSFIPPNLFADKSILFIIALMGWMPTAVDLSTWNSIWTVEKIKSESRKITLKETLLDFNIGYFLTIILSLCFVTLGAYVMYGTGEGLSNLNSSEFAGKLVGLYTITLGDWSYWIIAISAFSVMLSTTIACFDGYARSIQQTFELLFHTIYSYKIYLICLLLTAIGGYIIIWKFMNNFSQLIDLATTISFIIAPFCAILNHKLIHSKLVPKESQPPFWLRILSYLGIIYLIFFSLVFIIYI